MFFMKDSNRLATSEGEVSGKDDDNVVLNQHVAEVRMYPAPNILWNYLVKIYACFWAPFHPQIRSTKVATGEAKHISEITQVLHPWKICKYSTPKPSVSYPNHGRKGKY